MDLVKILKQIRHGSQDSLDTDVYLVLEEPILVLQRCKEVCESFPDINANLVVIEHGEVVWCYKGTVDEVNNSIYYTYSLHTENVEPCPIFKAVNRNIELKVERTIRGILSYMSRTSLRTEIKTALKSKDLGVKIKALKLIDLPSIESFGKKGTNIEVYKFLCFQLVQVCMLYLGNEVYTKQDVRNLFPSLASIIDREEDSEAPVKLQTLLNAFISKVEKDYKTS